MKKIIKENKEVIRETNIFIVDEVSMMRADLFDKLEKLMRDIMESDESVEDALKNKEKSKYLI